MTVYVSIGDFSRATHLTVKTLRHYHEIGLLEPAAVDPHIGYRRYTTEQLSIARVIRRFRDLDMPLDDIRAVLTAPDLPARNERIAHHLARLEGQRDRTQRAVDALGDLLAHDARVDVELRSTPAISAAAITEVINSDDAVAWLPGALGELHATVAAQQLPVTGPAGGIYGDEIFTHHRGSATIFLPCIGPVRPVGRVEAQEVPAGEFAVLTHVGTPADVDRTYAALATYVARHTLAVDGPIREYYLVGQRDTDDTARWRTEIAWPVFLTATHAGDPGRDGFRR
jgi:DNA-binding transcriptional MerR regulator